MIKHYLLTGLVVCLSVLAKSQNTTPFVNSGNLDTVLARKIVNRPYSKFEIYPAYIGGVTFEDYVSNHFNTPKNLRNDFNGDVVVNMLIDSIGSVLQVEILKSQSADIDNETIRVLSATKWKPAIYDFKHVNYGLVSHIKFHYDSIANILEIKTESHYSPPFINTSPSPTDPSKKIFTAVEREPSFPGGINEFYRFLSRNIRYPKNAVLNHIEGIVVVSFVVERDGSLVDLQILQSPDEEISLESLRVLKLCPKFNPGIQNSKPVRVRYTMPLTFSLKRS